MPSNVWDEKSYQKELLDFHQSYCEGMDLPVWLSEIHCPFCDAVLEYRQIRSIGLCLNARNLGDIAIEFHCDKCGNLDTLYYKNGIENIKEFIKYLIGEKEPKVEPLRETKMYASRYNCLMEKLNNKRE